MQLDLPEVRLKPIVFQQVVIEDAQLLRRTGYKWQYDDIEFVCSGVVSIGDSVLIHPVHDSLHLTPDQLQEFYVPNDDDHWEEKLVKVQEQGFDYALYHMRSGLPCARDSQSTIHTMDRHGFYQKCGDAYVEWQPTTDDLLATDWRVAHGEIE